MQDNHIHGSLSALVMLAAIAITITTYASYKDEVVATEMEQEQASMDQAASAIMSYRVKNQASVVSTSTATTTVKEAAPELE